jgi:hypothetical protein
MQLTRPECKIDEPVGFNRPENISNPTSKYSGFILLVFGNLLVGIWVNLVLRHGRRASTSSPRPTSNHFQSSAKHLNKSK